MKFNEIISREDQYEVAKAKAEISVMAQVLVRSTEVVCDIVLSRFNDIYEEE